MSQITSSSPTPGPIEKDIIDKLVKEFSPSSLVIFNDSSKHAHHAGLRGASNITESHFRVEIVSDKFQGKSQPARHRLIYGLLDDEFKNRGLHALQMKTKTPSEFEKTQI